VIHGVSFLWLYVSDLNRSVEFYGKILGRGVSQRWHEGAIFEFEGDLKLGLHLEEGIVVRGNSPVITLGVSSDLGVVYRALQDQGVCFDGPITTEAYGKIATFRDPDGHALLLHEGRGGASS
jgi:predicted enzyme related to lactoylglutathione lyase